MLGAGSLARVPDELDRLGCRRVLLVGGGSGGGAADRLAGLLGDRLAGRVARVVQHVPADLVAAATAEARDVDADGLCSLGGGSATGLAKAVAVDLGLPILAVPTTYSGSEATDVYGVRGTRKRTGRDLRALPRVVVYDPELTTGLPAGVTAASAFNALAHAVAALCAPAGDRIAALYGAEAARLISAALPVALEHPADLGARADLLLAAYLAGSGLAAVGTGLHHRLCHVLGGRYGVVHADAHAALLPHTLAWDEALDVAGTARLAGVLASDDAVRGLRALARAVGLRGDIAALGVPAADLGAIAAEAAAAVADDHPRAGDAAWFRALLTEAYGGDRRSSEGG